MDQATAIKNVRLLDENERPVHLAHHLSIVQPAYLTIAFRITRLANESRRASLQKSSSRAISVQYIKWLVVGEDSGFGRAAAMKSSSETHFFRFTSDCLGRDGLAHIVWEERPGGQSRVLTSRKLHPLSQESVTPFCDRGLGTSELETKPAIQLPAVASLPFHDLDFAVRGVFRQSG